MLVKIIHKITIFMVIFVLSLNISTVKGDADSATKKSCSLAEKMLLAELRLEEDASNKSSFSRQKA